jgi:hypothetical protein
MLTFSEARKQADKQDRAEARRAAAARRRRESRAREKRGEVSGRIIYHEHEVAEALIAAGRLSEDEALRRDLVARELALVVADWAARWLRPR